MMLSRVPSSYYIIPRARPTSKSKRVKPRIKKNYELMRTICNELLENGTLKVAELGDVIECLILMSNEIDEMQRKKRDKNKPSDNDEWEDVKSYSQASTPKSDTSSDYPDNRSSSSSSDGSDECLNSPFSRLMSDFLDPDIENRELTDDEIHAVNTNMKRVIKYGIESQKSSLLYQLKARNPRFNECIHMYLK